MSESSATTVDYSALVDTVTRADVAAFRQRMRAEKGWSALTTGPLIGLVVVIVFGLWVLVSLLTGLVTVVVSLVHHAGTDVGAVFLPLVITAVLVVVGTVLARAAFGLGSWTKWYRLSRFAAANGFEYSRTGSDSHYTGSIFGIGRERTVSDLLHRSSPGAIDKRTLDIGSYSYATGSGKSRTVHRWGFMAIGLDRAMPNMVLDSRANNGLFGSTNLPESFSRDQVLSLEGDFDRYFTLYCPKEYERDALYVFTPDLMALLIDEAASFDVEIVDSWLFVYSAVPFDALSAATYRRLFRIVDTVGAKTLSQTDSYSDDRVGDRTANIVAPQGRRLRRGFSVVGAIAVVIVVALWLLPNVMTFFGH